VIFLHPKILLFLILPLIIAVYQLRRSSDTLFRRKLLTACLRVLALGMLVFALARPCMVGDVALTRVVAVVDCSPSMKDVTVQTAEQLRLLADRVGLDNMRMVVFGADARELKLIDNSFSAEALKELCRDEPGSDVANALALAAALCPDDSHGEIHLFSDGRETSGDMSSAALALGRRGLVLKYEEIGTRMTGPVVLRPLQAPASAAVGEAVTITARVESDAAMEATLTLADETGRLITSLVAHLKPGIQEVTFSVRPERVGYHRYNVSLKDPGQTVSAGILINRIVIGVFETAPEKPASLMLGEMLGPNAEVKSLTLSDLAGNGLDGLDVLALADTPARILPAKVQLQLRKWVENGGGLLVTGGRNSFGPGGYESSQLAAMLPLRFPQKKEMRDPSTALAVIIDTSGSMGREGVSLAQEVARLALKRLKPNDKAGIVEFYGAKRWAAPMQSASNVIAIQRALNRLSAGGGTVMLPAIEEAYYGLLNVRARTKHVLVLTDGGVETGAYQSLVRSMYDDKIHISTVLVGPRSGSGFLVRLANWGGGQFYVAPSRFKLPEVIFKQPSSSLMKPFVEGEMQIEPVLTSELTKGLNFESAPAVKGYVRTELKETAELLLRSEVGDPILARWHYGLGRTAVLTTRIGGDWSKQFLNWPKSRDLMANLVRQLCGVTPRQPVDLRLKWSAKGLDVNVCALSLKPSMAAVPLDVEIRDISGSAIVNRTFMPIQANQWQTRFEGLAVGDYVVEVSKTEDGKSLASGGLVVPAPSEFTRVGINSDGLAAAARRAHDMAATVKAKMPLSAHELWPLCAGIGLLCFVLMILARRLPGTLRFATGLRRSSAVAAVVLVLALFLPQSVAADNAPKINIFLKMRIERILTIKEPVKARQALEDYIPRIRWQYKDLAPLCSYLRYLKDARNAENFLVIALISNGDFASAIEVLTKLAKNPNADSWVHMQLINAKGLLEQKNINKRRILPQVLTAEEKSRITEIVGMKPDQARQAMEQLCRDNCWRFGDLALLCDYLRSMKDVPAAKPLLTLALIANGDIQAADEILSTLAKAPNAGLWMLTELARIKEMQGQSDNAVSLLKRALKMAVDPGLRFALRVRLAQLRYEAGELDAARAVLRSIADDPAIQGQDGPNYCARIAGLHGDDGLVVELFKPTGEGSNRRRELLFLGESLMRVNQPSKARDQFEVALVLSKLERDRRYVLDRIVCAARKMNALPSLMDEWLKSKNMMPEQLDILAGILGGELDRTTDLLALLVRRDLPAKTRKLIETPAFQERLAMLASETGKSKLARLSYRELIARQPEDSSCRNGYVRLLLMEGDRTTAQSVYREAIARSKTADELLEIAVSARGLGLKEVALNAVGKADGIDESAHLRTALFMADIYREQGDTDKALEILRKLERGAKEDNGMLMLLGQAYERHGYPNDAIRLFQGADPAGNEKLLFKLISLMEEQNRNDEVFDLWRKLWDTATEKMAVIQANDRLLDIGSKTGRLADLAIELEERLDQGQLREREQALLLDIYTSVGDPVSAADILMEISDQQGGATVDTYKRLLRIYIECELFGRCNAILQKLITLDPKNRDEHMQMLVLIALERKNDGDALVVLDQMAKFSKDEILRDSFSASVLSMIGRHEDAAKTYRRALADNPDEVEAWLLWCNAILAGDEKERAEAQKQRRRPPKPQDQAGNKKVCGTFSVLLEHAEADDLFTIAIDGMLNAGAPPYIMQNALRRLNERIAADPHNFHLHRLAADLNQELGQWRDVERILVQGLIIADDGRSIIMRELISMAKSGKRVNDVIAYGRSLLNIATHLPPAECLSLGTVLLERGLSSEADIAFQRVISDRKASGTARGVIEQFESAGLFAKAGKVIRSLLIDSPFDVDLLLRLGLIEEKKGEFVAAGKAYGQALDLMLGRLPGLTRKLGGEREGREYNVGDVTLYLAPALRGLIVSARTPESRREALAHAEQSVREELRKLKSSNTFAATVAENPRLHLLTKIMRRLSYVFHESGYGEAMDDELVRLYPKDKELPKRIVVSRRRWRSFLSASQFNLRNGLDDTRQRAIKSFLGGRKEVEKMIAKGDLNPAEEAEVLTFLAMYGYDDLIDTVKAGCNLDETPEGDGQLLLTVGLATDSPELVRDALLTNLSRLRRTLERLGKGTRERNRAYYRPAALYNQIVAAWPILSEQDRYSAVSLYGMLFDHEAYPGDLACSYHFLLSQTERADKIPLGHLRHYAGRYDCLDEQVSAILNNWLAQKPAAGRLDAVRKLLGPKEGNKAYDRILSRLAKFLHEETLTEELKVAFPELVAGRGRTKPEDISNEELSKVMAEKRVGFQKKITNARLSMGSDIRKIFPLHDITLRPAANILPPQELDILLKDLRNSSDPFKQLIAFLLLRHAGRETEALALLQNITRLNPGNPLVEAVQAALPGLLGAYGWDAYELQSMPDGHASSSGYMPLYHRLHDPLAILEGKGKDRLSTSSRRIQAASLMVSPDQYMQATCIYYADTRHPSVFNNYRLRWKAKTWPRMVATISGGLVGLREQSSGSILEGLGGPYGGQDELSHWLRAITTRRDHETDICTAITRSVSKYGLSPQLCQNLQSAAERSLLNRTDVDLIAAIAVAAPEQLPKELAGQMNLLTLGIRQVSSERAANLAAACKALGQDNLAQSLGRWSVTMDLQATGTSPRLRDYLNNVPKAERKQALKDLLPFIGLSKVRIMTGSGLGPTLDVLLDYGMTAEATAIVDCYLRLRSFKGTANYFRTSNGVKQLIGGIEADTNAKDDAVALVLAQLNRPEDYERLLWYKRESKRIRRSPINVGMNISTTAPMNNIGALPEPENVADINRYIDIHLNVGERLRREGVLSRENQVAEICMLGEWCANRNLKERVSALIKRADKMSAGMLTGKLWVADLHRLLGNEDEARQIELELLSHDLLPMPRVPAALEVLAASKGRAQADAVAFRVAGYSNHPKVLPLALRYAREQGLKKEYYEIAERLRRISTLFLPPGVQPSLKIPPPPVNWPTVLRVSKAQRPLAELVDDKFASIAYVKVKGKQPEMIYVPINHDGPYNHLSSISMTPVSEVLDRCEEIADHLFYHYGIRNVILEGMTREFVAKYNRIPVECRKTTISDKPGMLVFKSWGRILTGKSWVMVPSSNKTLIGPLTKLGYKYDDFVFKVMDGAKRKGWFKNREVFEENRAVLEGRAKTIAVEYNSKLEALLKEDPELKREYAITVTERNKAFLDNILAADGPGVVFFGAGHWQELEKQLEDRDISYALVVPRGLAWPPVMKDDADIYADMLELGCKLKKSSIQLGDGSKAELDFTIK